MPMAGPSSIPRRITAPIRCWSRLAPAAATTGFRWPSIPQTGLAYFPQYEHWFVYALDPNFKPQPFRSNGGWGGYSGEALKKRMELQKLINERESTALIAWDPVKQEVRWKVPLPRHGNGGVLTTAGNLVFEGTTKQTFAAFRATDGALLWEMPVQSAPVAGPITYEMDGVQYVAVNAGWGGGAAQIERGAGTALHRASARLLVFRLGAKKQLPPLKPAAPIPDPPPLRATEATVQKGAEIFARTCAQCHGQLAVGGVKDLRQMTRETHGAVQRHRAQGPARGQGHGQLRQPVEPGRRGSRARLCDLARAGRLGRWRRRGRSALDGPCPPRPTFRGRLTPLPDRMSGLADCLRLD